MILTIFVTRCVNFAYKQHKHKQQQHKQHTKTLFANKNKECRTDVGQQMRKDYKQKTFSCEMHDQNIINNYNLNMLHLIYLLYLHVKLLLIMLKF